MTALELSRIAYAANREYALAIGENPPPRWEDADNNDIQIWWDAALFVLNHHPNPEQLQARWLELEKSIGWGYGSKLDNKARRHPYHLPYKQLPPNQRGKLHLMLEIADVCKTWGFDEFDQ